MSDPTYVREEIDANPEWRLAFWLSEIDNDHAPIGWGRYRSMARALLAEGFTAPPLSPPKPIGRDFFITQAESDRGECGFPPSMLSNAVQLWSCMQGPRVSVAQAARAFNCEPALIVEAVRAHHWMFLESAGGALIDDPDREGAVRDLAGDALPASIDDFSAVYIGHEGE